MRKRLMELLVDPNNGKSGSFVAYGREVTRGDSIITDIEHTEVSRKHFMPPCAERRSRAN